MDEDEELRNELKMSKFINEMDDEFKERFKALKVLGNMCNDADEGEQKEIRKLELEFENKYKEIYDLRQCFINGEQPLPVDLIAEFAERATQMKDEEYDKLEVMPCDVKSIQNSKDGVSDFWIRSMLNHPIGSLVMEKDRPILGYLQNIQLDLHDENKGEGYDLIFTFTPNSYFADTVLKKQFFCKHKNVVDKTVSTEI